MSTGVTNQYHATGEQILMRWKESSPAKRNVVYNRTTTLFQYEEECKNLTKNRTFTGIILTSALSIPR
jgi:hypothetical protein